MNMSYNQAAGILTLSRDDYVPAMLRRFGHYINSHPDRHVPIQK
jgi:hypothetical protein